MEPLDGSRMTKRRKVGGSNIEIVKASYESPITDFNVLIVETGFAWKQTIAILDCKYFAARVSGSQHTAGIYVEAGRGAS